MHELPTRPTTGPQSIRQFRRIAYRFAVEMNQDDQKRQVLFYGTVKLLLGGGWTNPICKNMTWEKEHHLQNTILGGYVSSPEGIRCMLVKLGHFPNWWK